MHETAFLPRIRLGTRKRVYRINPIFKFKRIHMVRGNVYASNNAYLHDARKRVCLRKPLQHVNLGAFA